MKWKHGGKYSILKDSSFPHAPFFELVEEAAPDMYDGNHAPKYPTLVREVASVNFGQFTHHLFLYTNQMDNRK